ncbi:hypothetical protein Ahy_B01g055989 [Arachis hypogaea]|uniref:Protein kinase domain-containing protein n=1 Tax=Arachis hypogaea TaxID=3818 RepID=A0A445AXU6_ARAHY|nr:hypothetical protein Ahy_B01g055989 [Arachis hypogaea]
MTCYEIPSHVSEEEKDFLEKYYKRDPSKKGLVEELLVHEFVHAFNEHIDYELKHGDVKEQNDLVTTQRVKIADFDCTLRVVADGEGTLGCAVLEIITGEPLWHYLHDNDPVTILYRIGF